MKTVFALILLTALSASPIAADAPTNSVDLTMEERLNQVDLAIALRQYEKVQQMQGDARLEKALRELHAEPATEEESRNAERRLFTLETIASELRRSVLSHGARSLNPNVPPVGPAK